MTNDLHLSGPTVTLFGDRDALDEALSDELGRRGCSTHAVTIPMGWLTSVTHAVVRIDTPVGRQAFDDLASRDAPATHVVAVCETTEDEATTARIDEMCRQCGEHHDVTLIWHAPLGWSRDQQDPETTPGDLASSIADQVGLQEAWTSAPSFESQTFAPGRHRGHA